MTTAQQKNQQSHHTQNTHLEASVTINRTNVYQTVSVLYVSRGGIYVHVLLYKLS